MKTCKAAFITVVVGTVLNSIGCALSSSPLCCKTDCASEGPVGTVEIGGQVHRPCRLEIGTTGLTLRNALRLAGGVREPAIVQETTSNPPAVASLQELTESARDLGKLTARLDILEFQPKEALAVLLETTAQGEALEMEIERAKQQLQEKIKESESQVSKLIENLSTSFEESRLGTLREASMPVGYKKLELELISDPAFKAKVEDMEYWDKSKIEIDVRKSEVNEAEVLEELYDARGNTSVRTLQREFVVVLERSFIDPPTNYFIPYDFVVADMAGDIQLRDGDMVSVVDVHETVLVPPEVGPTVASNVVIRGYVNSPDSIEEVLVIGGVQKYRTPNIPGIWMLTRPAKSGQSLNVFLLSDRLVSSNVSVSNSPTYEGDVYTYLLLAQVPVVFETLLARTMEVKKQECLDKIHALRREHVQRPQQLCERVFNHMVDSVHRITPGFE